MASGNSKNGGELVVGALVSVISRNGVRYEGTLYFLNVQESTLGLENARSYGTDGIRRDGPQIQPSDTIYEIVQFCRSDIQELQVKSVPPTQQEEQTCSSSTNGQPQHPTMDCKEVCLNDVNKKTKKDEPRGRIRKTMMDSAANKTTTFDSQAALKKLDTTPCNSLDHGNENGHDRFYKRMKLDAEVSSTSL